MPNVYDDIQAERAAQRSRYSCKHDDAHTPVSWVFLICRHATQAVQDSAPEGGRLGIFRRQMVRVAALAVAAIEAVDQARERAVKPGGKTRPCLTCGHDFAAHDEHLACTADCECRCYDVAPYHPTYNPDPTRRFVESLLSKVGDG